MLELIDRLGRVAAEIFNGVLVAEPIGALDRVVHVPAPVVFAHVAERCSNAALRGDRMRASGKNFGDARGSQSRFAAADHGAQTGAAGADHYDVVGVVMNWISAAIDRRGFPAVACHVSQSPNEMRNNPKMQATATSTQKNEFASRAANFGPSS
jgi:hypothetical protein